MDLGFQVGGGGGRDKQKKNKNQIHIHIVLKIFQPRKIHKNNCFLIY